MQETWVWSLGEEDSPGEGSGNPVQYSCLGNPMGRGAWWATVHGVTKSWTQLSNWTTKNKLEVTQKSVLVCKCLKNPGCHSWLHPYHQPLVNVSCLEIKPIGTAVTVSWHRCGKAEQLAIDCITAWDCGSRFRQPCLLTHLCFLALRLRLSVPPLPGVTTGNSTALQLTSNRAGHCAGTLTQVTCHQQTNYKRGLVVLRSLILAVRKHSLLFVKCTLTQPPLRISDQIWQEPRDQGCSIVYL